MEASNGGGDQSNINIDAQVASITTTDGTNSGLVYSDKNSAGLEYTDGGSTSASVSVYNLEVTTTVTDGTNTSSVITETTNTLISSTDGGDISATIGIDVNGGGSIVLNMIDTTIGSSLIDIQPTGITTTVTDGIGTQSSISMYPDSMDIVATDGTTNVSCSVYTSGLQLTSSDSSSFNNNISLNSGDTPGISIGSSNPSTSDTTSIEFRSDSITTTVTDGVDTSSQTMTPTDITLEKVYDGYTHKLDFYNTGAIDLFMTDGISTSGGLYIEQNQTTISCGGTAGSTYIALKPTTISMNGIPAFDDDADASTLSPGDLYQTTGLGASPLDVAGILMIKQ
jgi:hypothetical protein